MELSDEQMVEQGREILDGLLGRAAAYLEAAQVHFAEGEHTKTLVQVILLQSVLENANEGLSAISMMLEPERFISLTSRVQAIIQEKLEQ